ncbi:ATPase [Candidatus Poribacteria bacterium]|nr:MAG: ATPase [Candidatus Poribacteria bacterium]
MANNFVVFISYSHDSPEHKRWVSELAVKLRHNGIDTTLDQWDLQPGDDITRFMERGILDADRILVVCTDNYVSKANAGEGGVGYERMIITKKNIEKQGNLKFIPIIRQTLTEDKTPEFLKDRVSIDFTDDNQFDAKFEELLHERLLVPPVQRPDVPHIESLRIKNYRALRDIELKQLKPLTVLLGANGSGKSTFFDVFAFLTECFTVGLHQAWNKRGGLKELRSRGCDGPIEFELKYREKPKSPIITYHLSIDENTEGPFVETEWLQWRVGRGGKHVRFLNFERGTGSIIPGEKPDKTGTPIKEQLDGTSTLAVNMVGQSAQHPRVGALRRFITDWHLSYLSTDATRQTTDDGPQKRLSTTGDNLTNVIQYLQERYPERLEKIISLLSDRVPRLEMVDTELMMDGRRLLKIKDAPFEQPILAKFTSDGTLKLLSYLILFHDRQPPQLIGIEEPENYLHPRLLTGLVDACRVACMMSQFMITTHSSRFVNELYPDEVWVLYRDEQGFTVCKRASEMQGIEQLLDAGRKLGKLWMEGFFEFGDPLTNAGGPKRNLHAH